MTSDTTQGGESAPFEVVRRRAMRTGPPPYQGASALRQTPAVVLDVLVHLLAGVIVGTAAAGSLGFGPGLVVGYVVVSFVHRVLLRRWWGATIGGALFGLRWIDTGTGRKPTLGWLAAAWFIRSLATVLTVLPGL